MARCRLIGLTKHLISVFILNEEGKLEQHRMIKGKSLELNESQLTFHVQRMINKKALKLVLLEDEETVTTPVVVKEAVPEPEEALTIVGVEIDETDMDLGEESPKKKRGRKKKVEEPMIDLDEDTSTL